MCWPPLPFPLRIVWNGDMMTGLEAAILDHQMEATYGGHQNPKREGILIWVTMEQTHHTFTWEQINFCFASGTIILELSDRSQSDSLTQTHSWKIQEEMKAPFDSTVPQLLASFLNWNIYPACAAIKSTACDLPSLIHPLVKCLKVDGKRKAVNERAWLMDEMNNWLFFGAMAVI